MAKYVCKACQRDECERCSDPLRCACCGTGDEDGPAGAQIRWCLGYIRRTYGELAAMQAHDLSYAWYASGGMIGC